MTDRRSKGDDLTGRRQGYTQLKEELHHFFKRIYIFVAIIGLTSTLGLVGYGFAIREIQNQRSEFCEGQNDRNANTRAALNTEAQKDIDAQTTEAAKKEIERRRDVTLGLIDLLQPSLDCGKVVETGWDAYLPW
jgi:hypothetical protein